MKAFYIAVNEKGDDCEHKHKFWDCAIRCARSQERYHRLKYGETQHWSYEKIDINRIKGLPTA